MIYKDIVYALANSITFTRATPIGTVKDGDTETRDNHCPVDCEGQWKSWSNCQDQDPWQSREYEITLSRINPFKIL